MARSILVVDDSIALIRFLQKKLAGAFHHAEIRTARTAADTYNRATISRPDIILIDYALPDTKADEVCQQLYLNPVTHLTPILLFYSDGVDAERIQKANPNIIATFRKPFDVNALIAEVHRIFSVPHIGNEIRAKGGASPTEESTVIAPKLIFRANTGLVRMGRVFRQISDEQLSGVLRISLRKYPIEIFCKNGHVLLASTKDLQLYSIESTVRLSDLDRDIVATAIKGQMDSSCPYFILLAIRGSIPHEFVSDEVHYHGLRLAGRAFTHHKIAFEFEDLNTLPEFTLEYVDSAIDAYAWCHIAMQQISEGTASTLSPAALHDIPVFTPDCDQMLSRLQLTPDELRLLGGVDSATPLSLIGENLGMTSMQAATLFFRLSELGILQHWPTTPAVEG